MRLAFCPTRPTYKNSLLATLRVSSFCTSSQLGRSWATSSACFSVPTYGGWEQGLPTNWCLHPIWTGLGLGRAAPSSWVLAEPGLWSSDCCELLCRRALIPTSRGHPRPALGVDQGAVG